MKRSIFLLLLLTNFSFCRADHPFQTDIREYDWKENYLSDSTKFRISTDPSHFTWYYSHIQYDLGFTYQEYYQYRLIHFVVWVNDDKSIEEFNEYSLEYNHYTEEIRKIKARVIVDGKVVANTTINDLLKHKGDIIDGFDAATVQEDKLAIKGLRKGCFLEFMILVEHRAYKYESAKIMNNIPIKKLIAVVQAREEMGLAVMVTGIHNELTTTNIRDKKYSYVVASDIPALREENFSFEHNMGIQFRLTIDDPSNESVTSRWQKEGGVFALRYVGSIDAFRTILDEIIKKLRLDTIPDPLLKAFTIENYVKKNFTLKTRDPESDIEKMYSHRTGTYHDFVSMISQLCLRAGLDIELLMTSSRHRIYFDPNFFSLLFTENTLIKINGTDYYIEPFAPYSRISLLPEEYLGQHALSVVIGANATDKYVVSLIQLPVSSYEVRVDSCAIETRLNLEAGRCNLSFQRSYHNTQENMRFYYILSKDKNSFLLHYVQRLYGEAVTVNSSAMSNTNPANFNYVTEPFVVKCNLAIDGLIKSGSDRIFFNAGILIGKQDHYQADSIRTSLINVREPKIYKRLVKIEIPQGYTVSQLEELNFKKEVLLPNKKPAFGFLAEARIESGYVIIECTEYTCRAVYPVFMYNDFINTLNLAAEFNERSIVFTKVK